MFIGHYGASLAAKRLSPRLSLAVLFLAVQFLDVLFSVFVLLGIEKMAIVHGFTAYNPYDLYWMPYSHSLVGALAWSVLAAGIYWLAARRFPSRVRRLAAGVLGAAVFSHFVLDVPVHTPDLPLWPGAGAPRIGLGLWNHRWATIVAELAVLAAGGLIYLRRSRPRSGGVRLGTRIRLRPRRDHARDFFPAGSAERAGVRDSRSGRLLRPGIRRRSGRSWTPDDRTRRLTPSARRAPAPERSKYVR